MDCFWRKFFSQASLILLIPLVLGSTSRDVIAAQLKFTWTDNSTNETGFKIERKTSTISYTQIAQVGANSTTFIDYSVTSGATYCYRVRAYNDAGNSAYSNEACGTVPISPYTLTVAKTGNGTVVSTPTGISCGSDCSETYTGATSVTLTATPASSYRFDGWSGGGCSGTASCTLLINTYTNITANFGTTTSSTTSTLGLSSIGSAVDGGDSNFLNGSKVTVGATGVSVTGISVYVGAVDAAPNNQYQVAIYTDQNGVPGTLVASSTSGTLTPNAWNTRPLAAPLQANTSYWLMYNTNGRSAAVNNMYYKASSAGQGAYSKSKVAFGSWPTPFGAATLTNGVYSLYTTTVTP